MKKRDNDRFLIFKKKLEEYHYYMKNSCINQEILDGQCYGMPSMELQALRAELAISLDVLTWLNKFYMTFQYVDDHKRSRKKCTQILRRK